MNEEGKTLWESKTFWGVVVMVFASLAEPLFGIRLSEAAQSDIAEQVMTMVGAAIAIYGRVVAQERID